MADRKKFVCRGVLLCCLFGNSSAHLKFAVRKGLDSLAELLPFLLWKAGYSLTSVWRCDKLDLIIGKLSR
ncbi:hypothetical protein D3Z42_00335 [Lachnospiraceae bacterium]|nr:hypothetical protein [Lachnospiraceae bacterium]NBI73930.1 hypothetical protein [Lachnospiraceae bacterium]